MNTKIVNARIEMVTPLTDTVLMYTIKPEHYVDYIAGQYLQVLVGDEAYSYSIANAPLGAHRYELHIRHSRESKNNLVMRTIKNSETIKIRLAFGDCCLNNLKSDKPILFIAVGSGFAPIKAMIEQLFADSDSRNIKLYWGARMHSDLYMHEKLLTWQNSVTNFTYKSCLTNRNEDSLITKVIQDNLAQLQSYEIVMCGPFDLMYKMRDALVLKGVAQENIFSDAFSFES